MAVMLQHMAAPTFTRTGRYRLRPEGRFVVLQAEEATRFPKVPQSRWIDVTPDDILGLVSVLVQGTSVKVK